MQTLKAIYENGVFRPLETPKLAEENGVFRPLETPKLAEGQSVQLIVDTTNPITPQEMLQLAAEVYEGLSETDVDEIEEIALKQDYFFANRAEE